MYFWPFWIYANLSGKNCQKKFGMAIFGHSASLFGKNVRKNLKEQFLAILNLYKSFWGKLSEIIWNGNFWPFWIYTNLFEKNSQEKFGTLISFHCKFIPVFLGKIVKNNLEQPFFAILNLYQSFLEKLFEIIWNSHFWPFWIYTNLLEKNCPKNSEWPFLAILNLYKSFWEKLSEKIWNDDFWSF